MDKAYEDDVNRQTSLDSEFVPERNRKQPKDYDAKLYKHRNENKCYFVRLKRFHKVFTRYDNLTLFFLTLLLWLWF